MKVSGSDELRFVPLGKTTNGEMKCLWGDPSFLGDFLPEKREISAGGFHASWDVLSWNRTLPPRWTGRQAGLMGQILGVKLLQVVDEYRKSSRAVKYAILFVALTFLSFFVVDVLRRSPFHPVHYTLVGLALVLFFVLLLSLSEYLAFNLSYALSSGAIVLLIALYTRAISRRWGVAAAIAAVLAGLYAFLLVLLQLEDYALLLGSLLLFVSLAVVMYLTRRIDWFALGKEDGA